MLDQEYIFYLLRKKNVETISELSKILGVNYFTLRYQLNAGNLRLDFAFLIANFLQIPVSSLLIFKKNYYIRCIRFLKEDLEYEISSLENVSYLMFCILSSENL